MLENVILLFFSLLLLGSVFTGVPILAALFAGLLIFSGYARYQGFSLKEIVGMWAAGVKTIRNILMTFVIIGFLTGLWRAGGTIPTIVYYASGVIDPALIVLLTFVLNCLLSCLRGTSFGTAATMGLISMTIASTLGASKALVGGAVLSGIYFGDRCSPVSTSALLTADLTGTNLYDNIQRMMKSALVPFLLSLVFYGLMGGGEGTAETASAAPDRRKARLVSCMMYSSFVSFRGGGCSHPQSLGNTALRLNSPLFLYSRILSQKMENHFQRSRPHHDDPSQTLRLRKNSL